MHREMYTVGLSTYRIVWEHSDGLFIRAGHVLDQDAVVWNVLIAPTPYEYAWPPNRRGSPLYLVLLDS